MFYENIPIFIKYSPNKYFKNNKTFFSLIIITLQNK